LRYEASGRHEGTEESESASGNGEWYLSVTGD
jgi:hypothetical protein